MKPTVKKVSRKLPVKEPLEGVVETTRQYHTRQLKERMLAALRKHLGVIAHAAKDAGIARKTHFEWHREDPDYREAVEEVLEDRGDFIERKLLEAINDKQPAVMIFVAKTWLKHRGYVERHEFSGPDGGEIRLGANMTIQQAQQELPPEGITEIVKRLVGSSGRAEAALAKLTKRGD